jgi:tripartite ATP-independent transporter DctP family solute receptor
VCGRRESAAGPGRACKTRGKRFEHAAEIPKRGETMKHPFEIALSRRAFMKATVGAAAGAALLPRRAFAAQFTLKLATGQDPTHPVNVRAREAIDRIGAATQGRVAIDLFPANQLGSDTDLLSQVRSGAVDFFNLSNSVLATLVPVVGILNTGFAFADYDTVWKAVDGDLGEFIRAQIAKAGLVTVSRAWDNGFRHVTTSTKPIKAPGDLKGLKIRVPQAPTLTSLFKALDASPSPINFNELYTALQTKIVEGEENPLPIIATTRLYEVQKFCSMTGHVWDPYWILGNRRSLERLPDDLRSVVVREFDKSALDERADIARLSASLRSELSGKGLAFNDVDRNAFRDALRKTSFYKDWKGKYGDDAWNRLEAATGKLA